MKKIFSQILGQGENEESHSSANVASHHMAYIGKNFTVGHYNLHVEQVIAEGGFGVVFRVRSQPQGELFAMKRIFVNNEQDLSVIKREITIVSSLSHKNIIQYVDSKITLTQKDIYEIILVTAFYPLTLSQLVQDKKLRLQRFNEEEVLQIICDVMEAVSRLHHCQTPIIHRDLKIENILVDQRRNNVLCDFGSATSRVLCPAIHGHQRCQEEINKYTTLAYRAPEMVDLYADGGNINLGIQTDIWALGVLAYCLCFFTFPFGDSSSLAIQSGSFTIPDNSNFSDKMHKLINYMLTYKWQNRPDIYQISHLAFAMMARRTPVENINGSMVPVWEELEKPPFESAGKRDRLGLPNTGRERGHSPSRFEVATPKQTSVAPRERPKPSARLDAASPIRSPQQSMSVHSKSNQGDPWTASETGVSNSIDGASWFASFDQQASTGMQQHQGLILDNQKPKPQPPLQLQIPIPVNVNNATSATEIAQPNMLIDLHADVTFDPYAASSVSKSTLNHHRRIFSDTTMIRIPATEHGQFHGHVKTSLVESISGSSSVKSARPRPVASTKPTSEVSSTSDVRMLF